MNLHRASKSPDWEVIKPPERTFLQKIASRSLGIITLANVITIGGLALVIWGLLAIWHGDFWLGLVLVAIGRLLDIADGLAAELTRTKSPLGELLDATADKIGTLLTLIIIVGCAIASWWAVLLLVVPQALISLVVLLRRRKGINIHPMRQGKLSMAVAWASIIGLLLDRAIAGASWLNAAAHLCIIISFILGAYALWQYSTQPKN